jgi:hypothetical protein
LDGLVAAGTGGAEWPGKGAGVHDCREYVGEFEAVSMLQWEQSALVEVADLCLGKNA